jgi:hypothetical protein
VVANTVAANAGAMGALDRPNDARRQINYIASQTFYRIDNRPSEAGSLLVH